jgi:hypothetical protein
MPTHALTTTSPPPGSSEIERLAREWIVKFAELYGVSLKDRGPRFVDLWVSAVSDLEPRAFDSACRLAMQRCKFLPMPSEIRSLLDQADAKGFDLEAETEWQKLLEWIRRNVFPDTGIRRGAPPLSPAVDHAAKAAGGIYFMQRCSEERLVWCRRDFLAAFKNFRETGQVEHLLRDGEAKKILSRLRAGPPALPSSDPNWEAKYPPPAPPQNVTRLAAAKDRVELLRVPTEEEWSRRKQEQRDRIASWVAEHPELHSK